MSSKANLKPEVITDRNGKVTTVYKKDTSKKTLRSVPSPTVSPVDPKLLQSVKNLIQEGLNEQVFYGAKTKYKDVIKALNSTTDSKYLEDIQNILERYRDGKYKNVEFVRAFVNLMSESDKNGIKVLSANLDAVESNDWSAYGFLSLHEYLVHNKVISKETAEVPNLEANMFFHFEYEPESEISPYYNYTSDTKTMIGVNKNPDKYLEIAEYLSQRPDMVYSEEGFQEYLKTHSALRDGIL